MENLKTRKISTRTTTKENEEISIYIFPDVARLFFLFLIYLNIINYFFFLSLIIFVYHQNLRFT